MLGKKFVTMFSGKETDPRSTSSTEYHSRYNIIFMCENISVSTSDRSTSRMSLDDFFVVYTKSVVRVKPRVQVLIFPPVLVDMMTLVIKRV